MSNIAKIKKYDIANGKGIRTSIFFSGCPHHCPNCFNQELWDYDVGKPFTIKTYENEIKPTINEHIAGISILGGEPMARDNVRATQYLVSWFKADFPDKSIWLWSGYLFEELTSFKPYTNEHQNHAALDILKNIDVLVDGRFVEKEKDLTLK